MTTLSHREGFMPESPEDLDEEALALAARRYGTTNTHDTLNAALREAAEQQTRHEGMESLAERVKSGQFDELLAIRKYR
ncbi:DUF2191 domain-containing protein [Actinoplanes sp. NPDC051494]|uniref:DUF2191 domain-containing protein n=1 Tax=Actinoplanes sp. NPDC051494 TaxID=3363907 RepID=UPI00379D9D12